MAAVIGACAAGVLPGYVAPQYRGYYERPRAALERNAAIIRSVADVNEQGYHFAYDTENGECIVVSIIEFSIVVLGYCNLKELAFYTRM